jgi:hypothetical protein
MLILSPAGSDWGVTMPTDLGAASERKRKAARAQAQNEITILLVVVIICFAMLVLLLIAGQSLEQLGRLTP